MPLFFVCIRNAKISSYAAGEGNVLCDSGKSLVSDGSSCKDNRSLKQKMKRWYYHFNGGSTGPKRVAFSMRSRRG